MTSYKKRCVYLHCKCLIWKRNHQLSIVLLPNISKSPIFIFQVTCRHQRWWPYILGSCPPSAGSQWSWLRWLTKLLSARCPSISGIHNIANHAIGGPNIRPILSYQSISKWRYMTHSSLKSIGVTTSFHEVVGNKSFRFPPATRLNSMQWKSFPTPFWKQAAWINKACSVVKRWIIPISKNISIVDSSCQHSTTLMDLPEGMRILSQSFLKFILALKHKICLKNMKNYISKINH